MNDEDLTVEREVTAGRVAPEDLMAAYVPKTIESFEDAQEAYRLYRAYRDENRPFRRAFGRGERWRNSLLAVGAHNAKSKDNA